LKEAFVAVGIALILTSAGVILWSLVGLRSVDRAEDIEEQWRTDIGWWGETGIDSSFDRVRGFYSVVLAGGLAVLVGGAALALHGWRSVREESPSFEIVMPQTSSGAKNYCAYCGGFVSPATVRCPTCGRMLSDDGQ
jgi:hypothetical protein